MKKSVALLLALLTLTSCFVFSSCGGLQGVNFYTVAQLKEKKSKLTFLKDYSGSDEALVCEIKDDAPAEVDIPSVYEEKQVIAVIGMKKPAENLSFVKIGDKVEYIEKCFNKYKSLRTLELPKSLKAVYASFEKCPSLEEVEFKGDKLELIDNSSFYECKKLKTLKFGKIGTISGGAFNKSDAVETLTFNDEVGTIESDMFSNCDSLKSVTFNKSVNTLGDSFCNGCDSLEKVEFFGNVHSIGEYCFASLPSLKTVTFKGEVDNIEKGSFSSLDSLKSVVFNSTVGNVSSDVLSECKELKSIEFKKKVSYIDSGFTQREKLRSVILPKGSKISNYRLTNLVDSGVIVGTKAFNAYCNKYSLKKIIKKAQKNLGRKFKGSKQISDSSARKYKKIVNGPILVASAFQKCYYKNYSRSKVKSKYKKTIDARDVSKLRYQFPNTVFTGKKAKKVLKGKPVYYALIETVGHSDPIKYVSLNLSHKIRRTYYHLYYRVSIWNAKNGKLKAWYYHKNGYKPTTFKTNEEYRIGYTGEDGKRYFKESNGERIYPFNYVMKSIFGRKTARNYYKLK
ncbi:MAG: leucine-rich repeat domain-containing protein [Ruminococcus sp.]|nr:leucine-rich repeat domain-containing protein [Ruminococcus sp.]